MAIRRMTESRAKKILRRLMKKGKKRFGLSEAKVIHFDLRQGVKIDPNWKPSTVKLTAK